MKDLNKELTISPIQHELALNEDMSEEVRDQMQNINAVFILPFDLNKAAESRMTPIERVAQSAPIHSISNRLKGYRILVVDDNAFLQILIQKQLLYLGVISMIAQNGQEALSLLEQHDFDAVLMDIFMPVMSGFEVAQLIRQQAHYASLPIISLSCSEITDLGERNKTFASSMDGHISRPIDIEQLCVALEPWLKC